MVRTAMLLYVRRESFTALFRCAVLAYAAPACSIHDIVLLAITPDEPTSPYLPASGSLEHLS
jgi:hypothetical protein